MRRPLALGLIASLVFASAACSLLTSLDGFSDAPEPDASAAGDSSNDGAMRADATPVGDAGDEALPSLHPQGTFEGSDCEPWSAYEGTLTHVATAHSGSGACRTCQVASAMDIFSGDDNGASGPGIVGATYRASAWVRTEPGRPAPPSVAITLRIVPTNAPFAELELMSSPEVAIDGTWKRIETTLTMTKAGTLNVFVYGNVAPSSCFLFDDVVLQRLQ